MEQSKQARSDLERRISNRTEYERAMAAEMGLYLYVKALYDYGERVNPASFICHAEHQPWASTYLQIECEMFRGEVNRGIVPIEGCIERWLNAMKERLIL